MRIAVDARIVLAEPTGMGRVVHNVLSELVKQDQANDYSILCRSDVFADFGDSSNFKRVIADVPQYSHRVFTQLPRMIGRERPDVVYFPYFFHPVKVSAPYVVGVWDAAFSRFPELLSLKKRAVYETMMRLSMGLAARVITDSESAKREIIKYFGIRESKIEVIHLGVETRFCPADPAVVQRFRLAHGLPEKFILYVGNHKPHKNLPMLVQAFALARNRAPHSLVFLDGPGADCSLTKAAVDAAGVADRTVFVNSVSDADLPLLYNAADLFLFPSLYEGFGLPPLEAMACGTPVITSNACSLPEVVGDAGIMVDPGDVAMLAEQIEAVLNDQTKIKDMSAKGIEQAKHFTWEETAKRTLKVFHSISQARIIHEERE